MTVICRVFHHYVCILPDVNSSYISGFNPRLVNYKRSSKKESIAYMDEPIVVDDNATNDESEIESNDNVYESDTEDAAVQTENDIWIEILNKLCDDDDDDENDFCEDFIDERTNWSNILMHSRE